MRWLIFSAAVLAVSGCATGTPLGARASLRDGYEPLARATAVEIPFEAVDDDATPAPIAVKPGARNTTVALARKLVGAQHVRINGKTWGDDCTGLVRGVYDSVGVNLMTEGEAGDNGVTAIWRFASKHGRLYTGGRPVAGDLVFFRETYDRNRDGTLNDGLTHIGLVEGVDASETVTVIHRVAKGIVRYRMNLKQPTESRNAQGVIVNDWLRDTHSGAAAQLTSQLFVGYATLLPVESSLAKR